MAYEIIDTELVYHGRIVDVMRDTISLPDSKTAQREAVVKSNAAAVVAVADDGDLILVSQYRHGVKEMITEIPAGMLDDNETDPLLCAKRELEEETGWIAGNIRKLFDMQVSPGYCNEIITVYLATDLKQGKQNFDEDEFIEIEKISLENAISMIENGIIKDAKTIAGLMYYRNMLKN